jgi:penicillin-binding protein 1C
VPGISGYAAAAPVLFESFDRLGATVPFRSAPPGVLYGSNADLPAPLRRFRHPDEQLVKRDAAPEIAFPADGVDLDLGIATGDTAPLIVKVRNGVPPFTFFANGAPFGRAAFARQESWTPDGPGFVTLTVLDAEGRSDAVTVFLD